MNWMKLQSGSDIRGTAAGDNAELTPVIAEKLGAAFAMMLAESSQRPIRDIQVAVGRDSRITGPALQEAAENGIRKAGATVLNFDMCTTPAMYMSILTDGFRPDGSIMITASHHPWNKNGLKFFTVNGGLEGKTIVSLLKKASELPDEYPSQQGKMIDKPFLPVYMEQLADRIRKGLGTDAAKPLSGLHIVVDAGNGAGGFYAVLLKNLGADISGSQFLEPDGMFPNHIPNPENKEAMASLGRAVLSVQADLGVIFDADCDRAAIVDSNGKEINRNRLIALISAILLENCPGATIVTDSVTSSGLKEFIEEKGGQHYRYKRGYRNVIDEAIRLNREGISCPLAIETSGHAALKENHFLDDGMYLVTVLIVKAMEMKKNGESIGSIISTLKEPLESAEIRLTISDSDFRKKGEEAIQTVTRYADSAADWHVAPDNREGIRISFDLNEKKDAGWFLLRLSVHDPVLPLNVESDFSGGAREILIRLSDVLNGISGINTDALNEYLG